MEYGLLCCSLAPRTRLKCVSPQFMQYLHYPQRTVRHIISVPFIWAVLIQLFILDFFAELYHRICFPLYGIPYVKRSVYIRIDRQKLQYLTSLQKIGCMYCGYANGLAHYLSVMAGETEKYWCGIMHKQGKGFIPPEHHKDFLPYGDEEAYKG